MRKTAHPDAEYNIHDALEHLRDGTREQYESPWTEIFDTESKTFIHELGEIPWTVDVLRSRTNDGKAPVDSNADVTVVKNQTQITVTNDVGDSASAYFRVRAM